MMVFMAIGKRDKELLKRVGMMIQNARKRSDLTQEQLAEVMDVSQSLVAQWENGTKRMSIDNLFKLAESLKTTPSCILDSECCPDQKTDNASLKAMERRIADLERVIRRTHSPGLELLAGSKASRKKLPPAT